MAVRVPPVIGLAAAGVVFTIGLAFPAAALLAVVYRFPVPFGGYQSGLTSVPDVLFAVAFYGALGGFVALGVAGAIAGLVASGIAARRGINAAALTLGLSAVIACAAAFTLAILDKLIGPW